MSRYAASQRSPLGYWLAFTLAAVAFLAACALSLMALASALAVDL